MLEQVFGIFTPCHRLDEVQSDDRELAMVRTGIAGGKHVNRVRLRQFCVNADGNGHNGRGIHSEWNAAGSPPGIERVTQKRAWRCDKYSTKARSNGRLVSSAT